VTPNFYGFIRPNPVYYSSYDRSSRLFSYAHLRVVGHVTRVHNERRKKRFRLDKWSIANALQIHLPIYIVALTISMMIAIASFYSIDSTYRSAYGGFLCAGSGIRGAEREPFAQLTNPYHTVKATQDDTSSYNSLPLTFRVISNTRCYRNHQYPRFRRDRQDETSFFVSASSPGYSSIVTSFSGAGAFTRNGLATEKRHILTGSIILRPSWNSSKIQRKHSLEGYLHLFPTFCTITMPYTHPR
jgi:hypothetical protein